MDIFNVIDGIQIRSLIHMDIQINLQVRMPDVLMAYMR